LASAFDLSAQNLLSVNYTLDSFHSLRLQAGIEIDSLASDFSVDRAVLEEWDSGFKLAPAHVLESLRVLARFADSLSTLQPAGELVPQLARSNSSDSESRQSNFAYQPSFPGLCPVDAAVRQMGNSAPDQRGAVFTRREVVDFILDLAGYTVDRPLHLLRLLEPSFGGGDFLLPVIERLIQAWRAAGAVDPMTVLPRAIHAVELNQKSVGQTRATIIELLAVEGIGEESGSAITDAWLNNADFLLTHIEGRFDFVVGNPPYIRQEMIPDILMAEYRARYQTIFDRSDIYVPFIQRSLDLLSDRGQCGFICSDRWMKNRYGGPLRKFVSHGFHLKTYVDMVNTPAFTTEVVAYPAITVIERASGRTTRVARQPEICREALTALASKLVGDADPDCDSGVQSIVDLAANAEPWILDASDQLALLRRLESEFPDIESAGCKVGIGVATGADKAFIGPFDALEVEPCRKLRLAMTRDIRRGKVEWNGFGVVNPFRDDGKLVNLQEFPKLKTYLESRREQIVNRHVAKKMPANWYRTIDRIDSAIAKKPKLLIPDIKGSAHIVYEDGQLYPHHNLYFITSETWDLRALRAVLMSGIARLFVAAYSTKMRGGYFRFQAQYIRRIRLPEWKDVPSKLKTALMNAAEAGDLKACNQAAYDLYNLSGSERLMLEAEPA
jgi:Eco57I restriction-modification methylase/TaqI-like C-terminal specificity domain